MTEKEIVIKALECCSDCNVGHCTECPIRFEQDCVGLNTQNALNLIKKQQKQLDDKCDRCIARDRAEAIKEFAKKIKEINKERLILWDFHIDNLVKEMVGDEE